MIYFKIFFFILFFSYFNIGNSKDVAKIKKLLEGRYELVYWIDKNIKYDYPDIAGILILSKNEASITLDKNIDQSKSIEVIGWGKYKINSKNFYIGWNDWKLLSIEDNVKTLQNKSPWKGMREYNVFFDNNKLILKSVTGKQSWILDKESLIYEDEEWGNTKQKVIRYWKKIN